MTRTVQRLASIGKLLAHPPHTKDGILKQLKQAAETLSEMKQSQDVSASIEPLTKALALPMIIKHKDKDVRLLATSCIMEILRIVAPEAPYSDKELEDIFQEVVSAFEGLSETNNSSFSRRTTILEIMANLRICVVMLDVGCNDLITEMFRTFFSVVSDKHPPSVVYAMQSIMAAILEESEKIPLPSLEIILNNLLKHKKGVSSAAHKLVVGVIRLCAEKLEPYVQRLLTSVMLEGRKTEIDLRADYHDIIFEIYQCAPEMLLAVIPNLTQELVNDKVDIRLKAVRLLGRLFSLPGQHVAKEYRQLFLEFLKRFTDKSTEVRLSMIDCAKDCIRASSSGSEAMEFLAALDDRVLDSEEAVRLRTVVVVCELAKQNHEWVPNFLLKHIAERLRDKKVVVRREAFYRLADVYKAYAAKCYEGSSSIDNQIEWLSGKLLRCCYDKDVKEFRSGGVELVFTEKLFPSQLSVFERARHWVAMYTLFEDIDKRALAKVLLQKKRLQEEVSKILTFRQKGREACQDEVETQKMFKGMNMLFLDDGKVEEHFQKLYKMKDNKIFRALSTLLNPSTTFMDSKSLFDDLMKRIGEHHPQHDFIRVLSLRCSFMLFGKEHVKEVLKVSKEGNFSSAISISGLHLIRDFAGVFPLLIKDVKEELLGLLLEGDAIIQEIVSEILAKAGNVFGGIGVSSSIERTLQKLCLEGTRQQAKFAVAAAAAMSADDGFKALSILFGRLVERLQEDNPHLPAILQSLGCVAQRAISIFETQEDDIVRFVVRTLLQKDSDAETKNSASGDWGSPSKVCQLKVFGLKTLVKSFLPCQHHPRRRLKGLLNLLSKILPIGELAETIRSSENDKAHLRLASVKGLLRLARSWDAQIPEPVFHFCVNVAQDPCIHVRQGFLRKLHQYLKDHTLSNKYASAFALFAMDTSKETLSEAKHHCNDFIETARLEARIQQKSFSAEVSPITYSPEYVITYLVHVLAYDPSFPNLDNAELYEPVYRYLSFYLCRLMHLDNDDTFKGDADNIPALLAIFRTIKKAEDVLDGNRTINLHVICDIGIAITKELGSVSLYSNDYPGQIPLPRSLYKLKSDNTDDVGKEDGSDLPLCLINNDMVSKFWKRYSRNGQVQLNVSPNIMSRKDKSVAPKVLDADVQRPINVSKCSIEALELEDKTDIMRTTSPHRKGRFVQKRGMISKQMGLEKAGAEHAPQESVSDKLRRSGRRLRGTPDVSLPEKITNSSNIHHDPDARRARRKHTVFPDEQLAERIRPVSQEVNPEPIVGAVASPQSEGRVLRSNRNAISDKHMQGNATPTSITNMKTTCADIDKGRVLRSRNVVPDKQPHENVATSSSIMDVTKSPDIKKAGRVLRKHGMPTGPADQRKASPESQKMDASKSPGRPSHLSNGVVEEAGIETSKRSKVQPAIARVLRKRSIVIEQQMQQNATDSDDGETTVTWRSRRRKLH